MSATRLILLRHAEVEEKYHRIFGGRIDMNLSPLGQQQAAALARHVRQIPFDAIYASPMKRVQQTLSPLLAHGAPPPKILPDLREIDFGEWTGLHWDDIQPRYQVSAYRWLDQLELGAIPHAEPIPSYRARIEACLRQISHEAAGKTAVVACHGGVIRMLLAIALNLNFTQTAAFEVDYASVTALKLRDHGNLIELLNFVPWRDGL